MYTITGSVHKQEDGSVYPKVVVEILGMDLVVQARTKTDDTYGTFSVEMPHVDAKYFVRPVPLYEQQVTPAQQAVTVGGASVPPADFKIRGNPTTVTVSNATPGTFVLLNRGNAAYTSSTLPTTNNSSYYTATVGEDKTAKIQVTPGKATGGASISYFIQCWKPTTSNGKTTFVKTGSGASVGTNLVAGQSYSSHCPGTGEQ